ncbi:MAG: tlde1 domain-containing protein [Caulobacteraceae bacterium]
MTWTYDSRTGAFGHGSGIITTGYSGTGSGRNNPDLEAAKNVGPIPRGKYRIGQAINHPRLGPIAIPLTPDGHDAKKRTEFFIHGDNLNHNASHGCIILNHNARQRVAHDGDKMLEVVTAAPHVTASSVIAAKRSKPGGDSAKPGHWTFVQKTGAFSGPGHSVVGYSGAGSGRNNPDLEGVVDVGPIPAGMYSIGRAQNSPHLGPIVMALTPIGHKAHNRTGFMIHGDNLSHSASHGCIILPRIVRTAIANGKLHVLEVVKGS